MVSVVILLIVFVLIAVRQIGKVRLQIWQIMLLGALGVLFTGQIGPARALRSINPDVMLFLLGMFLIGEALDQSGYLSYLSSRLFRRAGSMGSLVLFILYGMGLLSAFLMNDTLAIIGTPVVLSFARKFNRNAKTLLLALAFSITIGSVMSPIGNPQNLLIAIVGGVKNPFITFLRFLFIPTIGNLFLAYLLLRIFYRSDFARRPLNHSPDPITDHKLARLSQISLVLLVTLVLAKIVTVLAGWHIDFRLTYIAVTAALPLILLSPQRLRLLRRVDWSTLIFFAAMFVLMQSVWDSSFLQSVLNNLRLNLASVGIILTASVLLSQLISNVPLVALYQPMLIQLGATTKELMALAAGSTIAGNLSILGAASNVIIIQNAEKKSGETLTFLEFVRIGAPLTLVNAGVYWLYLVVV